MFSCLIIDDEQIARKGIEKYISQMKFLSLAGSLRTAVEAKEFLKMQPVDIMVLDIEMPGLNGLEFLQHLPSPPVTIIITAYADFALRGFELDVIDYIVKPASFERLLKACNKAREFLELKRNQKPLTGKDYFFVKVNGKIEKVAFGDILFVEAQENYSSIHTRSGKLMVLMSLKNMEATLPQEGFLRVHKSYIVAIDKITGIEGNTVFIGKEKVAIGRETKQLVIAAWTNNNLLKR